MAGQAGGSEAVSFFSFCSFAFYPGHKPVWWCHPHPGWGSSSVHSATPRTMLIKVGTNPGVTNP